MGGKKKKPYKKVKYAGQKAAKKLNNDGGPSTAEPSPEVKSENNSLDKNIGDDNESQNINSEMLHALRSKNEEIDQSKDLIIATMLSWEKDLTEMVDVVECEVNGANQIVSPSRSVLDSLEKNSHEAREMQVCVKNVTSKCEYMERQISVAKYLLVIIRDQIETLKEKPLEEKDMGTQEMVASTESRVESCTLEHTAPLSSSDQESRPREQQLSRSDTSSFSSSKTEAENKTKGVADKALTESPQENPPELLRVLKAKDNEMTGSQDLIINTIKFWVKEMLERSEGVTKDAKVVRSFVANSCQILDTVSDCDPEKSEMKHYVKNISAKVKYIMAQDLLATTLIDLALNGISDLEGSENFRRRVLNETGSAASEEGTSASSSLTVGTQSSSENYLASAVKDISINDPKSDQNL
ncbi:hypothetical protein SK128_027228, partial [Halocaridina rubra]